MDLYQVQVQVLVHYSSQNTDIIASHNYPIRYLEICDDLHAHKKRKAI